MSKSKHREVKLVMGDWNAKVGLSNKVKPAERSDLVRAMIEVKTSRTGVNLCELTCVRTCFKKTHKGEVRMRHDYEAVNTETMEHTQKAAKILWTERQSSEKST